MSEAAKISASHLARLALVYLRQSSAAQVEHNRESTDRQYALVHKAGDLGWPTDKIVVIDEDLGVSGSGTVVSRSALFDGVGVGLFDGLPAAASQPSVGVLGSGSDSEGPACCKRRKAVSDPQGRLAPLRGGLRPSLTATHCLAVGKTGRDGGMAA